ncbi:Hypothetical Protein FCC1311_054842 [Hondaea fermentalgiana]|uniref:Nucleotide-diphospho-sugar transferase domain-containing protein n=1 Tax=Hondaea fermentalgiana TaxID=2315210 RepID=A0A2R5GEB4_9STRA|nr:Hypothetical Protein FCC1311_054842 [Hondaea fermentalgiana]|eukprot:GBG29262.1 Hypothetical Protein FCC1311_054842 [Hondaea fermentalgiana]
MAKAEYERVPSDEAERKDERPRNRHAAAAGGTPGFLGMTLRSRVACVVGAIVLVFAMLAIFSSTEQAQAVKDHMNNAASDAMLSVGLSPMNGKFFIKNPPCAVANSTETLISANKAGNIVEFARHVKRDEDSFVTVTFASYTYRDALINWLIASERANIRSVVVVCLDVALQDYLFARGVPCFHAYASESESESEALTPVEDRSDAYDAEEASATDSSSNDAETDSTNDNDDDDNNDTGDLMLEAIEEEREVDEATELTASTSASSGLEADDQSTGKLSRGKIHKLWIMRVNYLSELLHNGIDVLFSDLDVVIVQDPRPFFAQAEIVASRGKFPAFALKRWGATACMGFIYFKSTPNVKIIIEDMIEALQRHSDDQIAVNMALLKRLGRSSRKVFGRRNGDLYEPKHTTSIISGKPGQVKLMLLSHHALPRFCTHLSIKDWNRDIVAAHCRPIRHVSKSREYSRDLAMARYNLFCDTDALAGHRKAGMYSTYSRKKHRNVTAFNDPTPESMLIAAMTPSDHVAFAKWLEATSESCDFGSFINLPAQYGVGPEDL